MATIDLSKATKRAPVDASTLQTHTLQNGNPFAGTSTPVAGGFAPVVTAKPASNSTDFTVGSVGIPGPADPLRGQSIPGVNPGIPQAFVNAMIDQLNNGTRQAGTSPPTPTPEQFAQYVNEQWVVASPDERTKYTTLQQAQDLGDITEGANKADAKITANEPQAIGTNWAKNVQPALDALPVAAAKQQQVDDAAVSRVNSATADYGTTLDKNQADRMSEIGSTNDYLTGLAKDYNDFSNNTIASNSQFASQLQPIAQKYNDRNDALANNLSSETQSTNAANLDIGRQLTAAANSTNANQTQLFNTLSGQAADINANQTGLYNTLSGQAQAINSNQTDLFNELAGQAQQSNAALNNANDYFQSQLGQLNDQQNSANSLFQGQLGNLNNLDQASLARYMAETDPMMAAMHAQGSDPADVARQQDVINRYEELSHPQVTDQERLVAELARRKFESDDQSNREALMQQLRGRGLQSGGLVIAGLQSANQQTANDRQMAELGLNAQAQQRAMQGMAGYSDASNVLRNADDAMRNFQDQYAQNDAVRRGNLSGQRESMNLAETNQETGRDQAGFDATTTSLNNNTQRDALGFDANRNTINDNYGRDESVFNAGTVTNNNNYARDESVFNAGTTTNNNNYARDQSVFNAGTTTNEDNFGRTNTALQGNWQINQGNLGNTQQMTTINSGINNTDADRDRQAVLDNVGINQTNLGDKGTATGLLGTTAIGNSDRYQGGIDKGDDAAGKKLDAIGKASAFGPSLAAGEVGTAQGNAGVALSGGQTFSTIQGGMSQEQHDALDRLLGRGAYKAAVEAV